MRKIITFILIGILAIFNFNLIKGSFESSQKLTQISAEQGKIKSLQVQNLSLKNQLKETDTSFYIEEQARNKLGYSKVGETTVVVADQNLETARSSNRTNSPKSNWQAWLDLIKN